MNACAWLLVAIGIWSLIAFVFCVSILLLIMTAPDPGGRAGAINTAMWIIKPGY